MAKKLRVVMNGLGNVGKTIVREAKERGVEFVGAVDQWEKLLGKDLGLHIGTTECNIPIESDLGAVIERSKPDLVVFATKTSLSDIKEDLFTCINHKVNVITTSEHAYYWKATSLELGEEINKAAEEAGITIFAGGMQDIFWGAIPYALTGASQRIESIAGEYIALIDDYGDGVMEEAMVGLTMEQFQEIASELNEKNNHLDAYTISLYALADKLKLNVTKKETKVTPIVSNEEMYCKALNKTIPSGDSIGNSFKTTITTAEEIQLSCNFKSKLKETGDIEFSRWDIKGIPNLSNVSDNIPGDIVTVTSLINRMVDVVKMKPGFVTVNDMPLPYFHAKPLGEYL